MTWSLRPLPALDESEQRHEPPGGDELRERREVGALLVLRIGMEEADDPGSGRRAGGRGA